MNALSAATFAALVAALVWIAPTPTLAATTIRMANVAQGDALPLFVAEDQGYFAKHGLNVEVTNVANPGVVVSALASGSDDIGFITSPVLFQAREGGIDLVAFAGGAQFPLPVPAYAGVVARTGTAIHTAKDLVGKTVGVVGLNAFYHILARRWLKDNGVDPSSVKFVEVAFPQMTDVLKSGQVDAVTTVDPFYSGMIDAKIGYAVPGLFSAIPDGVSLDEYVAQRSWAVAHRNEADAFRSALSDAIDYIRRDPAGARASLAKWTQLPAPVVAAARIANLNAALGPQALSWWIGVLRSQGLITSNFDPAAITFKP